MASETENTRHSERSHLGNQRINIIIHINKRRKVSDNKFTAGFAHGLPKIEESRDRRAFCTKTGLSRAQKPKEKKTKKHVPYITKYRPILIWANLVTLQWQIWQQF